MKTSKYAYILSLGIFVPIFAQSKLSVSDVFHCFVCLMSKYPLLCVNSIYKRGIKGGIDRMGVFA